MRRAAHCDGGWPGGFSHARGACGVVAGFYAFLPVVNGLWRADSDGVVEPLVDDLRLDENCGGRSEVPASRRRTAQYSAKRMKSFFEDADKNLDRLRPVRVEWSRFSGQI